MVHRPRPSPRRANPLPEPREPTRASAGPSRRRRTTGWRSGAWARARPKHRPPWGRHQSLAPTASRGTAQVTTRRTMGERTMHDVSGGRTRTASALPVRSRPIDRFRSNLAALRSAQKPSRGTAAYSRLVNRPAGRRVAAAAQLVGVTPNGATAASALLSGSGLVLLATQRPSAWLGLAVSVLLAAGYVLDSVDGQLARLRGGGSLSGEWLDHTVDCVKTCTPAPRRAHLVVPVRLRRRPRLAAAAGRVPRRRRADLLRTRDDAPAPTSARPARPAGRRRPPEHPLRKWLILPPPTTACSAGCSSCWPGPRSSCSSTRLLFAVNAVVMLPVLREVVARAASHGSEGGLTCGTR